MRGRWSWRPPRTQRLANSYATAAHGAQRPDTTSPTRSKSLDNWLNACPNYIIIDFLMLHRSFAMQFRAPFAILAFIATLAPCSAVEPESQLKALKALPSPQYCRVIDFEKVHIVPGFVSGTWIATISGTKPWASMNVQPVPLIYIRQPEYWGIEIVGCNTGIGLPQTAPYSVSIPVQGLGTIGVEIIGATKSEKFPVPPKKVVAD